MLNYETVKRQKERVADAVEALLKTGFCGNVILRFDVSGVQPNMKKEETVLLNLR